MSGGYIPLHLVQRTEADLGSKVKMCSVGKAGRWEVGVWFETAAALTVLCTIRGDVIGVSMACQWGARAKPMTMSELTKLASWSDNKANGVVLVCTWGNINNHGNFIFVPCDTD